jgi:DNA-binding HxlR family transcriptional regulator
MAEAQLPGHARLIVHTMEQLQGKWKLRILATMRAGPVRLGKLTRRLSPASKKVLTENLRQLESSGLVVRRDLGGTVHHVEYTLSEGLRDQLLQLLDHLADFGGSHLE